MGLYSTISKRLKKLIKQNRLVVSKEELTKGIDLSDVPREELEQRYINMTLCCVLYTNDYRSPVRGSGLYVAFKETDNQVYLHEMTKNSIYDTQQKVAIAEALKVLRDKSIAECPECAQMVFDVDENGRLVYKDGLTKEDIIEMLRKEAL